MIHHTPEGRIMELGLNYRRAPGGFCLTWVWFNFAKYETSAYRFRLRLHIKPYVLLSVNRWDVIENHLMLNDLALVNREWLADTNAAWRDQLRRDKASVQFGP
jgi:hypothetical protein